MNSYSVVCVFPPRFQCPNCGNVTYSEKNEDSARYARAVAAPTTHTAMAMMVMMRAMMHANEKQQQQRLFFGVLEIIFGAIGPSLFGISADSSAVERTALRNEPTTGIAHTVFVPRRASSLSSDTSTVHGRSLCDNAPTKTSKFAIVPCGMIFAVTRNVTGSTMMDFSSMVATADEGRFDAAFETL